MRSHPISCVCRRLAAVVLCGAALSAVPVMAQSAPPPPATQEGQGPPPHDGRPDPAQMEARHLDMLTRRLNLSPDQVSQVKAIDDETLSQARALRGDSTTPREDRRAKMQEIRKASSDKIRAVLNDEQKTKFDALEIRRREHGHDRGHGQEASPPPPAQP